MIIQSKHIIVHKQSKDLVTKTRGPLELCVSHPLDTREQFLMSTSEHELSAQDSSDSAALANQ